jgi:DNA-binding transcriptional LysR family regulator
MALTSRDAGDAAARTPIARPRCSSALRRSAAVEEPGLYLYYPRRAALAPKLRAFIDIARERQRRRGM